MVLGDWDWCWAPAVGASGASASSRLTLGFMSSTAFLSMWLSNTSTAAMVMPIVEAVAQQIISAQAQVKATQMTYCNGSVNPGLEMEGNNSSAGARDNTVTGIKYPTKKDHMMCKLMCLCITYSSTIGGLTTITGTSTNLIFAEHFNSPQPATGAGARDCRVGGFSIYHAVASCRCWHLDRRDVGGWTWGGRLLQLAVAWDHRASGFFVSQIASTLRTWGGRLLQLAVAWDHGEGGFFISQVAASLRR
ncbi:hypothetical protein QTO34_004772 [Cnephaeus nilssonii]|uniref:Citrate transporter-like domain-containing protein n=1 Tax=Cnephaeus nilssonii TaxID=3371016 RepID=A0AA40LKR3_CNENI|nr:hypothetical protein QTO34_004772 [Eptesicus nilssonii]